MPNLKLNGSSKSNDSFFFLFHRYKKATAICDVIAKSSSFIFNVVFITKFDLRFGKMSDAWKHYTLNKGKTVTCKICGNTSQYTSSTTGMWYHLDKKHGIKKETQENMTPKAASQSKRPKISTFFQKQSIEEAISRLTALDGFSFNAIVNSSFIRSAMSEKGYDFPKNHKQAIQSVKKFATGVRNDFKNTFNSLVTMGKRFSITLDEYTSLKNRRYMNINIPQNNYHWNLGLTRISGSLPAEKAAAVVTEKVAEFGLKLGDSIVCSVTDGASMMVKFGKLVSTEHQTCYTHGMHLAVQEVLYEKPSEQIQQNSFEETSDDDEVSSDESESDTEVSFLGAAMDENIPIPKVKVHLESVITKVRKIVKLFQKSPVENDVLQEEIKKKHGKEVSLILDCRTRWNSLLSMIQQFLKVKHSIRKVLKDISLHLICSDDEEDILSDIVAALEPVKLAAEALCRQNATLLTAEGIFKFLVNRLKQQDSPHCIAMKSAILRRFEERRQSNLVSLYRYLSNPECLSDIEEHKVFNMPPKSVLQKTTKNLLSRLFPTNPDDLEFIQEVHGSETLDENPLSLEEELEEAIQHSAKKQRHISNDEFKAISKKMLVYEATGKRTANLELLFNALETIPPTSVESERAFSAAGLFVTKIRSRMSDDLLDTLCFFKAHFLSKNKSQN
ncbi:uncharacterized protein LOC136083825 [Hydra vulgaris]|uniref:Uncharacterized protein LOC136083825 n=1 Tax=Hydra vulgaris TaxID=6087 RepID=A0ABM4CDL4_HYDVU